MSGVLWHDVECGAYAADLELWEELASAAGGPILDLGCGTGRVALHLARRGHPVTGVDLDAELVADFNERAAGLSAEAESGDARDFELEGEFALVLAPMQLVQLFAGSSERVGCLSRIATHLRPGGTAALAIVEGVLAGSNEGVARPIPDTREGDGWVYSSLPLETVVGRDEIVVLRLRQTVSPQGELHDEENEIRLQTISATVLEQEAERVGLQPTDRRFIAPTEAHVGSTVVLLERKP